MSTKTQTDQVHDITSMPDADPTATKAEAVQPPSTSRAFRAGQWIKKNKKTILAVGLGSLLVSAGAYGGRKTAPLHLEVVESDVEIEPVLVTQSDESNDTVA